MKIIFFSIYSDIDKCINGGQRAAEKNYMFLQKYFGEDNVKWLCKKEKSKKISRMRSRIISVLGKTEELSKTKLLAIENLIKQGYNTIFWDDSFGGKSIKYLKKKYSDLRIIKFFHDFDEFRYKSIAKDLKLRTIRGAKNKFLTWSAIRATHKANKINIKYADMIITLTERDSELFYKYHKRGADLILPISMPIQNEFESFKDDNLFRSNSILFVGALSYSPNYEAITEIAKVLTGIDGVLYILGKESQKTLEFASNKKIVFLGERSDLRKYYYNADVVIAPIFSGGGMKVKVCEALSYGKWIFGTDEAFEGYKLDYKKVGGLCNTAEQFKDSLNNFFKHKHDKINPYSQKVFADLYSHDAVYKHFERGLNEFFAKSFDKNN